ncbi:hypothetical protein COT72_03510 [archaeon CG10_big_fil_rev_8_21_14_0_10_43_11]|nr:MAG: hypothetical protein COT72_03510 [archaeon CG10_big_fil_rev_8_21_14_0_10_43_11]
MKFLHFSDTHIGKRNFKLEEREGDFERAFEQCVSLALEEQVDFVIHAGDMFDIGRPSHKSIVFVITQLKRLKKQNIPVFTVAGSHDMSKDDTVLSILEKVGLIVNLSSQRFFSVENDKLVLDGVVVGDAFVCGVPGRQAQIKDIFKALTIKEHRAAYRVFVFHHTISSISPVFEDIPTALLPRGFDYYAGGHWHLPFDEPYDTGMIVYPGSPEFVELKEMRHGGLKGVVLVDTKKKTFKRIPLATRDVRVERVDCTNMLADDVNEKCFSLLSKNHGTLLVIEVHGTLRGGTKSEINKFNINEEAQKQGYLYCNVRTADVLSPNQSVRVLSAGKSLKLIEAEYLTKKGYLPRQIALGQKIIQSLGDSTKNATQIRDAQKELVEEIDRDTSNYRIN